MGLTASTEQERELENYRNLVERLEYRDGLLIWGDADPSFKMRGKIAGRPDALGYRRIHLLGTGMFACHRIIFFMHHGWLPEFVDHIDGDCTNNRIENLRAATASQNARNCKVYATNTTGAKGVYWHKGIEKWTAAIKKDGRLIHLGKFDHIFEAACARRSAEIQIFGEFAR